MEPWVIWLIVAIALALGEIATLSLFLAPLALGALTASLASLLGAGNIAAFAVALVVSTVALAALRPIARRHLNTPARLRTGTEALIGQEAVVLETVTRDTGRVKLGGESWSARAYMDEDLAVGRRVHVLEIRGATAYVSE